MFVEQAMTSPVTTITPRGHLSEAWALLQAGQFRHLPVVVHGTLVGIISDRDVEVERARGWCKRTSPEIASVMRTEVATVAPDLAIEEAGRLMLERKIGALPVTDGGRLVGIVTQSDLFRTLIGVLGADEPSTRLHFELDDPARQLARITGVASEHDLPIVSLVTEPTGRLGARTCVVRVGTLAPEHFIRDLEAAGIRVQEPLAV